MLDPYPSHALEFCLYSEKYTEPWCPEHNTARLYRDEKAERVRSLLAQVDDLGHARGLTRERELIKWRVNEYNLRASSGSCSSEGSLEVHAQVQLSRLRLCDSGPQHQKTRPVESSGRFDDYAPTSGGFVPVPTQGTTRNNSRVLSGFITKRGASTTISAPARHDRGNEEPQTSHWRAGGPNWACPFAVHNPSRYWEVGNACIEWQGFPTIARVREHLKDVHDPQRLCPRCLKNFHKSEKKFQEHRAEQQCEARDRIPLDQPEALTLEQRDVLLKNFDAGTSDENKWRGYYHILFPDDIGYQSLIPYFNASLLPSRMSVSATAHHYTPPAMQKIVEAPLTPSLSSFPLETDTTATTSTETNISSDYTARYPWDWDPDFETASINDDAQTLVQGYSNLEHPKHSQTFSSLSNRERMSSFFDPPKHNHTIQEPPIIHSWDQESSTFDLNL